MESANIMLNNSDVPLSLSSSIELLLFYWRLCNGRSCSLGHMRCWVAAETVNRAQTTLNCTVRIIDRNCPGGV